MLPLPPICSASTFRPCQAVALREAVHRFGGDHPADHFWPLGMGKQAISVHKSMKIYEHLWNSMKIYENLWIIYG